MSELVASAVDPWQVELWEECPFSSKESRLLRETRPASMAYYCFDFRDAEKIIIARTRTYPFFPNLLRSLLRLLHRIVYVNHNNGAHKPANNVLIQRLKELFTFPMTTRSMSYGRA